MKSTLHSIPPRIALIGISGYGNIHLKLAQRLRDRGEIVIVAATVINPEEVSADVTDLRNAGCEIFSDYEKMLKAHTGRIDLCLVPTGIHWHARMTIAALEAGANVLVEKPLSGVMCEVQAVQAAERAASRFVAVGFQDYYEPGTAWLKQHLLNGDIGKIQSVRFLGMWPRPREYFSRNGWAGRLRIDGQAVFDSPLSNAFAHFAMLSLYFAGDTLAGVAESELIDGQLWRAHAIETFDSAVVRLRTPDEIDLWFGVTHACHETVEPEILITGDRGTAGWRYEKEAWWCSVDGEVHRRELPDAHGARLVMMETALRRLTDPTTMICTSVIAGRHTQVVESLHARIPVVDFPLEGVVWQGDGDAGIPALLGFESALLTANRSGSLLSTEWVDTLPLVDNLKPQCN